MVKCRIRLLTKVTGKGENNMLPITPGKISKIYGVPGKYSKEYHTGIDFVASDKDKYIYSIGYGRVLVVRYSSNPKGANAAGWGNYVIVRQDDGHDVIYAHLLYDVVSPGKYIKPGDAIGMQGSTGNSTGPHLHLEIRKGNWENKNDINPAEYLGIKNEKGVPKKVEKTNDAGIFEDDRKWAIEKGISDGSFPDFPVTRKENWAMLHRLYNLIKEEQKK